MALSGSPLSRIDECPDRRDAPKKTPACHERIKSVLVSKQGRPGDQSHKEKGDAQGIGRSTWLKTSYVYRRVVQAGVNAR